MKKILNNKILIILGLFIFTLFLSSSNVSAYSGEDYLLSPDYNTEWIESYLDLNQNPVDGIKGLIDTHPDYFTFTSDLLGKYWLLEKYEYTVNGETKYAYAFFFSHSPIYMYAGISNYSHTHYPNEHYCTRYIETLYNRYLMLFDEDGFYATSSLDTSSVNGGGEYNINGNTIKVYPIYQTCYYEKNAIDTTKGTFIKSSHDIVTLSGSTVFQLPELEKATTLAPVIQREKTKGTLQVVLTEIIQILPLIIVVLVSFLGLRKALKMLSTLLNRS